VSVRWGQKHERSTSSPVGRPARDEVTGLLTFAPFLHQCGDALAAYVDATTPAEPAVLLVDIDGIHSAVDTDGRVVTDEVVALMAGRIAREVGALGVLARTTDHQVGVLFAHLPTPATALDLAYRIVAAVSSPAALANGRRVQLSATCGLVTRDAVGPRANGTDLLRGAGLAVSEARRVGRNRIEVCTPGMVTVADETVAIGKDLRQALAENGLRVCYQPLVDLASGSTLGFEALVRWTHPVHGHVAPSRFVPVAEQFGLISQLGRMVLFTATAQIAQWSTMFDLPLAAHVNVSGMDLAQDSFVAMVGECLQASALPAGQLVLEVTEVTVEPDLDTARRRFEALRETGVRIALDDFGTGRSALSYLQSLPVDILKVDRSYLDGQSAAEEARADDMLRGVVGLAQALGMTVYGEGIEDEHHRSRMRRGGCETGQGYLFARPLPPEDALALLRVQTTPHDTLSRRLLAAESAAPL
jgi:predicted signal transduction protein with EAL and GGDEF domain